ncbi:MAG TPA: CDP-alcohol phosphatidyltransferase family protein [Kineosporiaceae bacterium]
MPPKSEYLRAWSRLHGDAGTGGLVGWWLVGAYRLARPLAGAGISPNAVTGLGLAVALAAPAVVAWSGPAGAQGHGPLLASALVITSGVLDGLDGAVALLTGRSSRRGFVIDSVCDRIADAAYAAALWSAGAPGPLAVAAAAVAWLHEYTRARAVPAGMPDVGVVTVAERPTRVIVTASFLLGAGLRPGGATRWAAAGAATWLAVGVVGAVQLGVTVARRLR